MFKIADQIEIANYGAEIDVRHVRTDASEKRKSAREKERERTERVIGGERARERDARDVARVTINKRLRG